MLSYVMLVYLIVHIYFHFPHLYICTAVHIIYKYHTCLLYKLGKGT